MNLFVDDEPFVGEVDQQQSLGALAQEICARRQEEGERMVVSVACNGQTVSQAGLAEILASPAGQFERVDLVTMPVAQLVEGTLSQSRALFEQGATARNCCADLLSEGNSEEAMNELRTFCDIWQQVQDCVRISAAAMHLNLDDVRIEDMGFTDVLDEVKRLLGELKEAMQHRDTVMVADILRYEFEEPTANWQKLMARLQTSLIGD